MGSLNHRIELQSHLIVSLQSTEDKRSKSLQHLGHCTHFHLFTRIQPQENHHESNTDCHVPKNIHSYHHTPIEREEHIDLLSN